MSAREKKGKQCRRQANGNFKFNSAIKKKKKDRPELDHQTRNWQRRRRWLGLQTLARQTIPDKWPTITALQMEAMKMMAIREGEVYS